MTATVFGTVPGETVLWWSSRTFAGDWLLPDARYLGLGEALYWYEEQRRWAREYGVSPQSPHVTVDDWWHPGWLPLFLMDAGMLYAMDVAASDGTIAPILRIDGQSFGSEFFEVTVAPSLGRFITERLDDIDAGEYVYDADKQWWTQARSS